MPYLLLALLVLTVMLSAPSTAADWKRVVPTSRPQELASYAPVVKRVSPAVVSIHSARLRPSRRGSLLLNDPFFRHFFGERFPGLEDAPQRDQHSLGSGVMVDPDGLIVTNDHVIEGGDEITVVLADRREFEADVVVRDKRTDLAVLRIHPGREDLPFVPLRDSDDLLVGDIVLALGNPFGVGQTVTSGIVSGLARTTTGITDFGFFIQTDAAINPGNSGGALVTLDGGLVGINTAIYSESGGSIGIGFAIPSNMVATVVGSAESGGEVVRPWASVSVQTVTRDLAHSLGLDRPGGVLVVQVYPNGPADRARIRQGDVILAVNGKDVPDKVAFGFRIATGRLGSSVPLTLIRRGRTRTHKMKLEKAPRHPPLSPRWIRGRSPFNGARVGNLSPAMADRLGLDPMLQGVLVLNLERGSAADHIGFRKNDIIHTLNGKKIQTILDLSRVLASSARTWRLELRRGGDVRDVVIR